jgi:hypothetical protein
MGIYYSAVEDDPLDSGGNSRVIEGAATCTIQGEDGRYRNQTFIGHRAYCDVCKSVGFIVPAPGSPDALRMRDLELGQQEALGGDLVICKCARHPRIIPVYGRSCMIVDDEGSKATAGAVSAATIHAAQALLFDDRYVLRDANGVPIRNTRYAIQHGEGSPQSGQTDGQGHTHLLAAVASEEDIHIYLGEAA